MPNYNLNYTGAQVNEGIGKAMTALQEHQSLADYRTSAAQDIIDNAQSTSITNLQTAVGGLGNVIGMRGWNQLVNASSIVGTYGSVTITNMGNGTIKFNGTASSTEWISLGFQTELNHKYFIAYKNSNASNRGLFYNDNQGVYVGANESKISTSTGQGGMYFKIIEGETYSNDIITLQLIDLTALFGAGNEPSSVSDFRTMFPADYYPYCSGSFADLLWTNASPSSSYVENTIALDFSNYNYIMVEYVSSTSYTGYLHTEICKKGFSMNADAIVAKKIARRNTDTYVSSIHFSEGKYYNSYGSETVDNSVMIPYKIYGVR